MACPSNVLLIRSSWSSAQQTKRKLLCQSLLQAPMMVPQETISGSKSQICTAKKILVAIRQSEE